MEEQKQTEKTSEEQEYKFMDCMVCGFNRRFVSSLSPKSYWICTECRTRRSKIPFKLEISGEGYKITKLNKKDIKKEGI